MSRWKIALIVIVVVVVAVFGLRMCHRAGSGAGGARGGFAGAPGKGDQGPVPVTVVPVVSKNVPIYLTALGTVQAKYTVSVRPQVSGQLMKLSFAEGGRVKKGQVIAKIDPRTYQSEYDQAVARRQQDQAQLATAKANLARSENLIQKGFVSRQDLETQRNTVRQLKAAVTGDNANVEAARVNLDYTDVTSPIDGLAGIRQVDPGNVLTTADTIVVLTQVRPINVMFTLPEQDLDRVRRAQAAEGALPVAALDRVDSHVIADDGMLKVIDNQINTSTGTFQLKAEFANQGDQLWPGQFVNVRMRVRTVKDGLVVPTQAVQRGPDGDYVYVVGKDDKVQMRNVVVAGEASDTASLIGKGLELGERVVTEGQFRLKPGSKVVAYKPGEVPKAPTPEQIKKAEQNQKRGRGRHH